MLRHTIAFKKYLKDTEPEMSQLSTAVNQISQMLEMQNAMNLRVSETWRENNYEWYRAIWVECAEMLDHYGWKWWKHQEVDVAQVQLELVDASQDLKL